MSPEDQVRTLLEEGLFCLGLSKDDEALERWRAVLELDPGNPRAREYINFVLEQRGELVAPEAEAAEPAPAPPERLDVASGVFRQTESGELVAATPEEAGGAPAAAGPPADLVRPAGAPELADEPSTDAPADEPPADPEQGRIRGDTAPVFLPAEMVEEVEATVTEVGDAVADAGEPLPPPALPPPELVAAPAAAPPAAAATEPPPAEGAPEANPLYQGALDLFEAGEYTEALSLVERVLAAEEDDEEARALRKRIRDALLDQFRTRIGSLQATPRVNVPDGDLVWLNLDPRAAFLLSRVDGVLTFEEIIDLSNLDVFTANKLLHDFLDEGLISVGD